MSRVLVVDDDPTNLHVVSRALRGAGFAVLRAATGRDALDLLKQEPCDLVVSGLDLPDISGLDVLRRLRADHNCLRFIVMTDYGTARSAAEAFKSGATGKGRVLERVKGGLSVDIGVKAFLPGSQVDLRRIRNLDKLIGQRFKFKVIKFNKKRGNIVLSRRVLLEQEREEQKRETLKKLAEGAVMTGVGSGRAISFA